MLVEAKYLKYIINKILIASGTNKKNAMCVSESLLLSNLCGVDTHGLYHLPLYIDWIKKGEIAQNSKPEIIKEDKNCVLLKGNWTFGQVTAKFATRIAIRFAQKYGMAIVSAIQVTHTGRLGEYVEMATKEKMVAFIFSGGFSEILPITIPYGGKKPVLSTNPFAFGFPVGRKSNIICDFATSKIAGSKILMASTENTDLPEGSLIDKNGRFTNKPDDFFKNLAYLIPFGGHKGYAMMLANEFIGGIVSSAKLFSQPPLGGKIMGHSGFTMIVFKADLFESYKEYCRKMREIISRIKKSKPADGFEEVLVPGDIEKKVYRKRIKEGIPVPDDLWKTINKIGFSLGLSKF